MPAGTEDLTFGFDTSFFEKGIGRVSKGLNGLQTTTATVAKGVSKGLTSVALKFGSIFAGVKAVQGALRNMPEIGQAFGIAKDVFLKNLLFPLRKKIFPLLQKMLNWVRDSRGMFVRWGQSLANVFGAVVDGVKVVISFIKKLSTQAGGFAEKLFGQQIKGIGDIFNILSFKLAVIAQFASLILQDIGGALSSFFDGLGNIGPSIEGIVDNLFNFLKIFTDANEEGNSFGSVLKTIAEGLGKMAGFVIRMTDSFLDGFVPAISQIMTPIQKIAEAWAGIFNSIFGSTDALETWGSIFEVIGTIIGTTILTAFEAIAFVLERIEDVINYIKGFSLKEAFGGFADELGDTERFNVPSRRVNDAIMRPDGSVIETSPDDTLIATKNPISAVPLTNNNQQKTFNMTVAPTIVIEQGTEEAGRAVGLGLMDELQVQFNREFERGGF